MTDATPLMPINVKEELWKKEHGKITYEEYIKAKKEKEMQEQIRKTFDEWATTERKFDDYFYILITIILLGLMAGIFVYRVFR